LQALDPPAMFGLKIRAVWAVCANLRTPAGESSGQRLAPKSASKCPLRN